MTLGEKISKEKIHGVKVFENFDMTNHSTLKTKSLATLFLELHSLESLKVLQILKNEGKTPIPLGKGSNTLFPEKIESVPYSLRGDFCRVEVTNSQIFCGAGATLSAVFQKAYEHCLAGFEPLALIPGTVGGALRMNAGCYGSEISQMLESVIVKTLGGEIFVKKNFSKNDNFKPGQTSTHQNSRNSQNPSEINAPNSPINSPTPLTRHNPTPYVLNSPTPLARHSSNINTPKEDKSNLDESDPLNFSYRSCEFLRDNLALFASFSLKTGDKSEILQTFKSFKDRKNSSQPTCLPSLGSVFKRCGDFFPAKAIDRLGLKGERVGNMAVSEKHSGFIVNLGGGTAKEFLKLVEKIEDMVYNKDKVILEREFGILT